MQEIAIAVLALLAVLFIGLLIWGFIRMVIEDFLPLFDWELVASIGLIGGTLGFFITIGFLLGYAVGIYNHTYNRAFVIVLSIMICCYALYALAMKKK